MKKSYNIKKSLSMLLLLAFSCTSMYSMEVEQPKPLQIQVFISFVENKTENDLTITIDDKDYVIKSGKTEKLNQGVNTEQSAHPYGDGNNYIIFFSSTNIEIKYQNKALAIIMLGGRSDTDNQKGIANFRLISDAFDKIEESFNTQTNKSYEFGIQLTLEGKNLEESTMEVVTIEK